MGARDIPDGGNVANTSIRFHGGKTLALVEGSHPVEVKLPSLDTVGNFKFNGELKHTFTAHPIIDNETGEMIYFGYKLIPNPYLKYGIADKNLKIIHSYEFKEIPWATMHHSFACTKNYVIFMFWPLVFDGKLIALGQSKDPYMFDKSRKSRIAICPKYMKDEKEVIWFDAEPRYCFHIANAFERKSDPSSDDSVIELNLCAAEYLDLQLAEEYKPVWRRYVFNLNSKKLDEQDLLFTNTRVANSKPEAIVCEFPVINEDLATVKHRYSWACRVIPKTVAMMSIIKFDLQDLTFTEYELENGCQCGEWVFTKSTDAVQEDDGYLMTFVYNSKTNQSNFAIIDAKTMDASSVTTVQLPRRVPFGFHGLYVTDAQLAQQ